MARLWRRLRRLSPLQWGGLLWLAWLVFAVVWWTAAPAAPEDTAYTEVCTGQGMQRVRLPR